MHLVSLRGFPNDNQALALRQATKEHSHISHPSVDCNMSFICNLWPLSFGACWCTIIRPAACSIRVLTIHAFAPEIHIYVRNTLPSPTASIPTHSLSPSPYQKRRGGF
ncbi:hypothetical protein D1007_54602 [Hordeum vulgare]|nr:hypothetical protein D1007_54602 [Hordeum vulgare]